jgi:predicted AlkP superfamily phosphohydrolase/phosphomutase
VFVNVAGRERFGVVPQTELGAVKDDLVARFAALRGPDGKPVTDVVHRSEDVFAGDSLDGAPDLMPVLRDHRFELNDELFHRDPFTDVSDLPRGVHHPDGIVVVAGPQAPAQARLAGSVMDVAPTLLYMAGLKVPEGLDGEVLTGAFGPVHLERRPVEYIAPLSSRGRDGGSPYSAADEELVEESLRGLGYL